MGSRGPQKTPAVVRELAGRRPGFDAGGRPIVPPAPTDHGAPDAPDWLSDYGREVWELSIRQLITLNLTKAEDFAALGAYCQAVDKLRLASLDIQARGIVLEHETKGVAFVEFGTEDWTAERAAWAHDVTPELAVELEMGYHWSVRTVERKPNPAVAVATAAEGAIVKFGDRFGFSPSAENNLAGLYEKRRKGAGPDAGANPFESGAA